MRPRSLAWVLVASLVACGDPVAARRIDQLERELAALRSPEPAPAAGALGEALAPLRNAMETLARRGDAERARWGAVTAEVTQLASLVRGFVDDTRREEVDGLRQRLQALEAQAKAQASARAEETELLLRALEATAARLETFLQKAEKGTAPPPGDAGGERKSASESPWLQLLLLAAGTGAAALWWWRRARPRRPTVVELPAAVVDAPPPVVSAPRQAGSLAPLALRASVPTTTPEPTASGLRRWLADEPRVLDAPAPRCEVRGSVVHVEFHVPATLPAAERAGLVAEVLLHERPQSQNGRRTA